MSDTIKVATAPRHIGEMKKKNYSIVEVPWEVMQRKRQFEMIRTKSLVTLKKEALCSKDDEYKNACNEELKRRQDERAKL